MYRAPHTCPVCHDTLEITRLECRTCDTRIEGHFQRSPLETLSGEQIRFVEVFLRNEGKITWVAEELGLSYPTARAKLEEIVDALGVLPSRTSHLPPHQHRRQTLERLAAGEISVEQALQEIRNGG